MNEMLRFASMAGLTGRIAAYNMSGERQLRAESDSHESEKWSNRYTMHMPTLRADWLVPII
ncbi:hypothetical protein C1J03_00055 [Sulfitobacter sp. SK012]|nr:hypothetical protein C1J03_00055 [Sulfitobacter sp. SK012]